MIYLPRCSQLRCVLSVCHSLQGDLSAFEYSNNLRPQSLFPEG